MARVVVTGMGGVTRARLGLARDPPRLRGCANAVRYMTEWDAYDGLNTRLGAPIDDFEPPAHWSRKQLRSMGRVSQLAVRASELALADAGLPAIRRSRTGAWASPADPPSAARRISGISGDVADRLLRRHQRQLVRQDDAAHGRRERRHVLRSDGPHHPDVERLHVGQPGHRLRLRSHPRRHARR